MHIDGREILDQVEVELGQAGEQGPLLHILGPLSAQTHPGVDHTELGEVGALAAHQHGVHIKLDALKTELGQPLTRHTQSVSQKTVMLEPGHLEAGEVAEVLRLNVLDMSERTPDGELLQPRQRPDQVDQHARLVDRQEERPQPEHSLGQRVVLRDSPEKLLQEAVLGIFQGLEVITVDHQIESAVICY